jgi:deoxyadenosine/deoxycytidine kinase
MKSRYLCVSGMMGSGKTTLAKNIARALGYKYLPLAPKGAAYLDDLFDNPKRWAFDAQITFFSEKAVQIKEALDSGESVVVDRSLYEDAYIFAKYFYDNGHIDKRSFETFNNLAEHLIDGLYSPDLVIYCELDLEESIERIKNRAERKDGIYPAGHLENIYNRYLDWSNNYKESEFVKIDSMEWDFRNKNVVRKICMEIHKLIEYEEILSEQIDLFEDDIKVNNHGVVFEILLDTLNCNLKRMATSVKSKELAKFSVPAYPYAYIAAPFTGVATEINPKMRTQLDIFESKPPHGELKAGGYRHALSRVSTILESLGLNVLLPHRDVNEWGKKTLNAYEVFSACSEHVINCDLFVGLLGQSNGAHYEYGLAKALNKPSIIVHCSELADSFIAEGIEAEKNTLILSCEKANQIHKVLNSNQVTNFITKYNF